MTIAEQACIEFPGEFFYYRDNMNTMCREAVSIYSGKVFYEVTGYVLQTLSKTERGEVLGSIGDAPWGALAYDKEKLKCSALNVKLR